MSFPSQSQEKNSTVKIFKNGIKNPKFDPNALDYKPAVYRSRFNMSLGNMLGEFPPVFSHDYILNQFTDFAEKVFKHQFGDSHQFWLHHGIVIPANIKYNGQILNRVLILASQRFIINVPENPHRSFDDNELDALPIKTIGTENSATTIVVPPGESCTICKEEFVIGAKVFKAKCGHVFYEECIKTWLKLDGCCPNCKRFARAEAVDGASVRIRAEGSQAGGVLILKDAIKSLNDNDIIELGFQDFLKFSGSAQVFPIIETANFSVLPLIEHMTRDLFQQFRKRFPLMRRKSE